MIRADAQLPLKPPVPRSAWSRLAACTAAAALLQLDGTLITVALPSVAHDLHISTSSTSVLLNRIVLAATLVAGLTFAVMIGAFYIAEQYLQRVAGFSALGASGALVLVALLVGAAAPMAGRLVDRHGEQLPALLGCGAAALGLTVLGIPGMPLDGVVTILPLIPIGLGLGMLFVPTSRAALNASPLASHGRTSALLSVGRLLGATVGAGLAGIALSGTLTASTVHRTVLLGATLCVVVGLPASTRLTVRGPAGHW
jgi:MFS family permease